MTDLLAAISALVKNEPWIFIASSVVTYVGGVLTKPFADHVAKAMDSRKQRKRLRNALYKELGGNVEKLVMLQLSRGRPGAIFYGDVDAWERREVYDLALKSEPVLFRELGEAHFFTDFYFATRKLRGVDATAQHRQIVSLSNWIELRIKKGPLSRRKLNAAIPLLASPYGHTGSHWLNRQYHRISRRNIPKVTTPGIGFIYPPADTLAKKLRALWTGTPGTPREHRGPSPVGEQAFGNLFRDLSPNTQKTSS